MVVSDDYKITYAGYYATTWTVYARANTNSDYVKVAEIAPSALLVTDVTRLSGTYPVVSDTYLSTSGTKLADYADEYNTLKAYAGRPVEITYESAIENNQTYEKYFDKPYSNDENETIHTSFQRRYFTKRKNR